MRGFGLLGGRAVLAACVLMLVGLPAGSAAANTDWTQLRTLNIAHQGGENEAPSNTMYAYERSLRLGADMLEVDIHTTSDGELVVMHDATVDRTTNGSGRVYDKTLAEVQALDAAHNLVPGEGTESGREPAEYPYRGIRLGEREPPKGFTADDFRIPTLDEVMDAFPDVPINIEIKGAADTDFPSFERNADALAAYLNELGRTEGIMVASFNDAALMRFHERAPQIDMAPGIEGVGAYKLGGVRPPEGTKAFQVPIEFNGITVTDQPFVERAHADGYGVHVWTINDPAEMNLLLDWGVDGIMTAEPIRLEQVLCERDVGRPARPASAPGVHCTEKASIACEVEPVKAKRDGGRVKVTLKRADEFAGQCAGTVKLRADGVGARGKFDFGDVPPSDDGPKKTVAAIKLAGADADDKAKATARPYLAFAKQRTVTIR